MRDFYRIKVKCPICGAEDEVMIKRSEIETSESGILRVPIEHESPTPHMIIIDIDANGFIRGTYLIKRYIPIERIPVLDTLNIIGPENFAKIIGWGLLNKELYLYGDDPELIEWTKKLIAYISDGKIKIRDTSKTKIYVFNPKEPDFSVAMIARNIKSALSRIKENRSMAAFLRHETKKYLKYLDTLEAYLSKLDRKIKFKDLAKEFSDELNQEELKFLLAILKARGLKVTKKVDVPELKIVDLF